MSETEFRSIRGEVRATTDEQGNHVIEGYAAVWDSLSSIPFSGPRGEFYEMIQRGAFLDSIKTDEVGCFHDHNTGQLLGRTRNGTLEVKEDDHGLFYRCVVNPDVSYGKDVVALIIRQDLFGNSFGMRNVVSTWDSDDQGRLIRTVVKATLFDVGPVAEPVYTDTEVALRSLRDWEQKVNETDRFIEEFRAELERIDAMMSLNEILDK